MPIYRDTSDSTDSERADFRHAIARGVPFEIDEATYLAYRDDEIEHGISYDYPIVMIDGTERRCDFVWIVGNGAYPYFGCWREDDRYFCQQIVDRLELTADQTDQYLPPPPGWMPEMRQPRALWP
jgi:hypothetical protein